MWGGFRIHSAHYSAEEIALLNGSDKTCPEYPNPGKIENPAIGRDPYIKIMPNRKTIGLIG